MVFNSGEGYGIRVPVISKAIAFSYPFIRNLKDCKRQCFCGKFVNWLRKHGISQCFFVGLFDEGDLLRLKNR